MGVLRTVYFVKLLHCEDVICQMTSVAPLWTPWEMLAGTWIRLVVLAFGAGWERMEWGHPVRTNGTACTSRSLEDVAALSKLEAD